MRKFLNFFKSTSSLPPSNPTNDSKQTNDNSAKKDYGIFPEGVWSEIINILQSKKDFVSLARLSQTCKSINSLAYSRYVPILMNNPINSFRVIVIGYPGVGKRTLISSIVKNAQYLKDNGTSFTVGLFDTKKKANYQFEICDWILNRLYPLSRLTQVFRGRLSIIAIDSTDYSSSADLKKMEKDIDSYCQMVDRYKSPEGVALFVVTKIDDPDSSKEYIKMIKASCEKNNYPCIEVSATKNTNIASLLPSLIAEWHSKKTNSNTPKLKP